MRKHILVGVATSAIFVISSRAHAQQTVMGPGVKLGSGCSGFSFGASILNMEAVRSGAPPEYDYPTVARVMPNSPASDAGLKQGDVLLKVGDKVGNAQGALKMPEPGTVVPIRIKRGAIDTTVTLIAGKTAEAPVNLTYDSSTAGAMNGRPRTTCMVVTAAGKL